jgi:hypothetical protein
MIEAMGGEKSEYYNTFLSLCGEAYNILRKSSNLLLNLMLLMIHSNIPQLVGEKDLLEVERERENHLNSKFKRVKWCMLFILFKFEHFSNELFLFYILGEEETVFGCE